MMHRWVIVRYLVRDEYVVLAVSPNLRSLEEDFNDVTNANKTWAISRYKHCIARAATEDGRKWEHILLASPSRFMYFETTEGGMETHYFPYLLQVLPDFKSGKDLATRFMRKAKIGQFQELPCGVIVRVANGPDKP